MKKTIGFVLLSALFMTAIAQENVNQGEKKKTDAVNTKIQRTDLINSGDKAIEMRPETNLYEMKMSDGIAKTCFGQFFDSGGPNGAYKTNEDYTYTLESGTEGAHIILRFVEFYLSDGDELTVYDGSSTGSRVIGTFTKINPMPFELKSTGSYLTFAFHSDETGSGSGWRASIACYVGDRKVLTTDGMASSTRLIYSIDGIKSESEVRIIEDILSANDFVLSTSYDKTLNLITVSVAGESFKDLIFEQIKSAQDAIGHAISVKLEQVIPSKPLK